jgi:ADP-ribosylation factor GTPase-activating protein 2/3
MMIVGGNANAREAFGEMTLNLKDLKSKYTSKNAQSYKSKLQRIARQAKPETQRQDSSNLIDFDQPQQQQPLDQQAPLINFDDSSIDTASANKTENIFDDLDIFKPIAQPTITTKSVFDDLISTNNDTAPVKQSTNAVDDLISPKPTTNHSVFDDLLSSSSPPATATKNILVDDDPFDEFISSSPNPPPTNSAVDDFFDQFESTSKSNNASPKASTKKRQLKPPKFNHNKLGARKVQSNVFQQQTALALKEEKMREQGIDEETIGRTSRNQAFALDQSVSIPKLQQPYSRLVYHEPKSQIVHDERLGMMSLSLSPKQEQKKTPAVEEDHFAREKFGNAKAISSDQYFGRNDYDPQRSAANASRLAQFQGSQSISSDQYFGRKSTMQQGNTPLSKKILRAATKSATKIQNILADMEENMK